MTAALSELTVTEFLALARLGFVPKGMVVGSCVYSAGTQYDWTVNEPAVAVSLAALGADGIMTDDPAAIVPALRSA